MIKLDFIKPKDTNLENVDWELSEHTRMIIKYYSDYTEYTQSEVVDEFLKNILKDDRFLEWVHSKRNNKRMLNHLRLDERE